MGMTQVVLAFYHHEVSVLYNRDSPVKSPARALKPSHFLGHKTHVRWPTLMPSSICRSARIYASTIMVTNSSNDTFGTHASVRLALDASPIKRSISVGQQ